MRFILILFSLFINTFAREIIPPWWEIDGPAPKNETLSYFIALKQNNISFLESKLNLISNPKSKYYGKFMNKQEILDIISPDKLKINSIYNLVNYNNSCINGIDYIKCTTKIYYIEKIFNITIFNFRNIINNQIHKAAFGKKVSIPNFIHNDIDFVLGLSEFPYIKNNKIKKKIDQNGYISAYSLNKLYNISDSNKIKSLGTQAVAEFQNDNCINNADLNNFENENNLPEIPLEQKNIIGNCNTSTDTPDVEASLDLQFQMAVNPSNKQMYINVPQWQYDFAVTMFNLTNPPLVNSISWGWAESQQCEQDVFPSCYISVDPEVYSKRVNIEFMKLSLRGITLISSSGDAGSPSRINEDCTSSQKLNPIFPTSSPWVTSVGGTIVMNPKTESIHKKNIPSICKKYPCIIGGDQLNCNYNRCSWTSGGGFSNFFERPWWQVNFVDNYLNKSKSLPPAQFFNKFGRAYPDVALVAHNYLVEVGGSTNIVDGTSASAPSFSGMIAKLNNIRLANGKGPLGAIGPLLYQMANECPNCFIDITTGSNNSTEYGNCKYGYTAGKGFDPVYGLGLPNYGEIEYYIKQI